MAEKENKKPIVDVEKPGTTPAEATSRPVIVSKGPAMKDPMVNDTKSDGEASDASTPLSSTKKRTIQPLSEQPEPASESSGSNEESQEKAPEQTPAEELAPDLAPADETDKSSNSTSAPEISQEEIKRQELVDSLVTEKKYFVPIGAVQKKRTARNTTLLFLVLLLALGGGVAAIDAEIIQTNVTLPFDLIK